MPIGPGGGGTGSVKSVSVVNANGLTGSVTSPTLNPAITLSTTITGILKGKAAAIQTAIDGTDFLSPASIQNNTAMSAADVGSVNAIVINPNPPIAAYINGYLFIVNNIVASSTGTITVKVNTLAPSPVYLPDLITRASAGDVLTGCSYLFLVINNTMILLNPSVFLSAASVYSAATQNIPTTSATALTFDTVQYNSLNTMFNIANPSRLVCPFNGYARLITQFGLSGNTTGNRLMEIYKNGAQLTPLVRNRTDAVLAGSADFEQIISPILAVNAADYFETYITQTSGVTLATPANSCWSQLEYINR